MRATPLNYVRGKFTNNRKSLSLHSVCVQLLCRRIIYAIAVIKK